MQVLEAMGVNATDQLDVKKLNNLFRDWTGNTKRPPWRTSPVGKYWNKNFARNLPVPKLPGPGGVGPKLPKMPGPGGIGPRLPSMPGPGGAGPKIPKMPGGGFGPKMPGGGGPGPKRP
jgi:hypothetical protein